MPALKKTTRQAHKTVKRISGLLTKAKKHHRQAQNSVKAIKKAHGDAKKHVASTKKGMTRMTGRKAYTV
jgi:hypothetical protein|tara:strand:+ start:50 stop:256 length:207 start_codon:yes stop_codon:yes gene_type:complete